MDTLGYVRNQAVYISDYINAYHAKLFAKVNNKKVQQISLIYIFFFSQSHDTLLYPSVDFSNPTQQLFCHSSCLTLFKLNQDIDFSVGSKNIQPYLPLSFNSCTAGASLDCVHCSTTVLFKSVLPSTSFIKLNSDDAFNH